MGTEVIFNNKHFKDSDESFELIKSLIKENTLITGSVGNDNNFIIFNNVNKANLQYYINEYKKFKKLNKEVKFVIQTHDGKARKL